MVLWSRQPGRQRPLPGRQPRGRGTHQNSSFPLPLTGSRALQDCTPSQQGHLVADLTAASAAHETGVGGGTHKKDARAWNRNVEYCDSIRLGGNYFLNDIPRQQRIELMGAFAMAVREGQILRPGDGPLAKKSVTNTITAVAATFRENGREDPHKDTERNVGRLLQWQLRSYAKNDPKEKQQKALPVCVHRLILSSQSTELRRAMGKLAAAAHFWAMRSFDYSKVPKAEQRQTKQLCLRSITFIKGGNILDHSSPELSSADCVSITFERQKNDRKSDIVTQWRTTDPVMCPVKLWASIITRILTYKGTNKDSPVSLARHRNKIISITSEMISNLLKDGVVANGETKLGIQRLEVGTHSIRSGAAMAMYLAGLPIFLIMLIGCWSRLAFLKYIRKQVQEFSHGISSKMITVQSFKHINNPTTTNRMDSIVGDSS